MDILFRENYIFIDNFDSLWIDGIKNIKKDQNSEVIKSFNKLIFIKLLKEFYNFNNILFLVQIFLNCF